MHPPVHLVAPPPCNRLRLVSYSFTYPSQVIDIDAASLRPLDGNETFPCEFRQPVLKTPLRAFQLAHQRDVLSEAVSFSSGILVQNCVEKAGTA